jgi:hypothetical protein
VLSANGFVRLPTAAAGPAVSQRDNLVARLFRIPGDTGRKPENLLGRAAQAHRMLLDCAAAEPGVPRSLSNLLPQIGSLLERGPCRRVARRFLVDPAFVEGLHRAAGISRSLASWHRRVAEPSIANVGPPPDAQSAHRLGNSLLAALLRDDPRWRGRMELRTDVYGRLRFPLCDWSLALCGTEGPSCVLSDERVTASVGRREVRLSLGGPAGPDLLVLPRCDWLRIIVANDPHVDGERIQFGMSHATTRLQFGSPIPGWRVRYEPVIFGEGDGHSALTGGLVSAVLKAIARHAPAVGREFGALMSTVRGWELPAAAYGTIQSFSDPTVLRVMGLNVSYGPDDEPCVCPFCFTWFGHELGHTKSYLIETILHVRGEGLTTNQADYTDVIERYGRPLSMRTLLQVPYTHLYEWTLLMDFLEGGFAALPWEIDDDPLEFGEDIHQEIVEAFERIETESKLTPCGQSVVARLHSLCSEARVRWQMIRSRTHGSVRITAARN